MGNEFTNEMLDKILVEIKKPREQSYIEELEKLIQDSESNQEKEAYTIALELFKIMWGIDKTIENDQIKDKGVRYVKGKR